MRTLFLCISIAIIVIVITVVAAVVPVIQIRCKKKKYAGPEDKSLLGKKINGISAIVKASLQHIMDVHLGLKDIKLANGKFLYDRLSKIRFSRAKTINEYMANYFQSIESTLGWQYMQKSPIFVCSNDEITEMFSEYIRNFNLHPSYYDCFIGVCNHHSICTVCSAPHNQLYTLKHIAIDTMPSFQEQFVNYFKVAEWSYCHQCKIITQSNVTINIFKWPKVLIFALNKNPNLNYPETIEPNAYNYNPQYFLSAVLCKSELYKSYLMLKGKDSKIEVSKPLGKDAKFINNPDANVLVYSTT
jgi:hypothetical protein